MPCYFVVQESSRSDTLFTFSEEALTIGRSSDMHLCLKHITVSRYHVLFKKNESKVENQAIQEPLLLNDENTQVAVISSGDRLQIGCFQLTFFDEHTNISQTPWENGFIADLNRYEPASSGRDGATLHMNPENLQNVQRSILLIKRAEIVSLADETKVWKPKNETLRFGKGETVPVSGWFLSGCVATIQFSGIAHTLKKLSTFTTVKINGEEPVEKGSPLTNGDVLQIGRSLFRYQITES